MARHGENIRKRQDGRWEARFITSYDGKHAKYRYIYADSYTEVKAKRDEFMVKFMTGQAVPPRKLVTFEWLTEKWLSNIKNEVKQSTYSKYIQLINRYIFPEFKKTFLMKLNPDIIKEFSDRLLSKLSPKTVTDVLSVIKQILRFGNKAGFRSFDTSLISAPKRIPPSIEPISKQQKTSLEQLLWSSDDTLCMGILLTMYTGIRIGELCGLRWEDICISEAVIYIRRTVGRIKTVEPASKQKTKVILSEPKTESSKRIIPLPSFLMGYLEKRRKSGECYLMTGTSKPSEPHTVYIRYKHFLKQSGLDDYTFHAIRHTFATYCVEAGFDIKSLSEILGHSNVTTTLRCYVHPSLESKRMQMERLSPYKTNTKTSI